MRYSCAAHVGSCRRVVLSNVVQGRSGPPFVSDLTDPSLSGSGAYSARNAVAIRDRAAQPAGTSAPSTAMTIPAQPSSASVAPS